MFEGRIEATAKGHEIEFAFVQGAAHEFHGSFYKRAPDRAEIDYPPKHGALIYTSGELERFCSRCMEYLRINFVPQELFGIEFPFGILLEEVFRNTAEHGYLSDCGERYARNLRSVRLAKVFVEWDRFASQTASAGNSQAVAAEYFGSLKKRMCSESRTVNFFEISVFDSGPGFAASDKRKYSDESLTERQRVARCFELYRTSKDSNVSGAGLQRILRAVSALGGFLRLRTGGAEAFFASVDSLSPDVNPELYVHDQGPGKLKLPHVEGSLLTIALPILN
jgi:hypothetical protein